MAENVLYYGDNLDILRRYIKDETIDLVYLDPPFKSDQDYNVLFAEQNGTRSAAQIKAFEDTWHWDESSAKTFHEIVESGPQQVSQVMQAFNTFLGGSDMRKEAASAGFYKSAWGKHPRLQLLTIEELLGGKGIDYPPSEQVNVTLKRAPKAKSGTTVTQAHLFHKERKQPAEN